MRVFYNIVDVCLAWNGRRDDALQVLEDSLKYYGIYNFYLKLVYLKNRRCKKFNTLTQIEFWTILASTFSFSD